LLVTLWPTALICAADQPPAAEKSADEKPAGADDAADPEAHKRTQLAERDRYNRETAQQQAAGSMAAAIASAEKMLAVEREVLDADHPDIDGSLLWLAELYSWQKEFAKAREYAELSLATQTRLHGEDSASAAKSRQSVQYVERVSQLDAAQLKRLVAAGADYQKALSLQREGKLSAALEIVQRICTTCLELFGNERSVTANNLLLAGQIQNSLAQYDDAATSLNKAIQIYRQSIGTLRPDTAYALASLSIAERNRGRFDIALSAQREAVAILEKVLDPNDENTRASRVGLAICLGQMAFAAEERDDIATAKPGREEAFKIWSETYPADDWRVSNARGWLQRAEQISALTPQQRKQLAAARQSYAQCSRLYEEQKYDEAVAPGQQALAVRREILGNESSETGSALNLLGLVMAGKKDFAKSEAMLSESMEIWGKLRGDAHPEHALVMQNLAEIYEDNNKVDQAQKLMRRALEIRQRAYGNSNSETLHSVNRLANLLSTRADKALAEGNFAAAKSLREEVVTLRTEYFGPDHWRTLDARWFLKVVEEKSQFGADHWQKLKDADAMGAQADQFAKAGQFAPAVAAMEEAASLRKDVYGPKHLLYGMDLERSASLNFSQSSYARSAELYGQVRDMIKAELSGSHPYYASATTSLGVVFVEQKNLTGAVPLLREAWQIRTREYGADNDETKESVKRLLDALAKLATSQENKPDLAAAKKSREEVVAVLTQLYGEKNWQVNDARWALYQTEQMGSWRGNQKQQLTQTDGLLGQAAQIHEQIEAAKKLDDPPTAEQIAQAAQQGIQAAAQAVSIRKQVLGAAHPAVADALEWQATLERDAVKDAAAQSSFEQAAAIRKKSQGAAHPSYVKCRASLARVMPDALALPFDPPSSLTAAQKKRIAQRDAWFARAEYQRENNDPRGNYESTQGMLQIEREVFGENHPDTAGSYERLSDLAFVLGNIAEARQTRGRLVDIYTRLYGADCYQVYENRERVTHLDRFQRLTQEQRQLLARARAAGGRLGKNKEVPYEQRPQVALALQAEVRRVVSELLGEDTYYLASMLDSEAELYNELGQADKAENAQWQAAELVGRIWGKKHPEYFRRLNVLATNADHAVYKLESNHQFADAQQILTKLIVIQTMHYGAEHWQVRDVRARLAYNRQREKLNDDQRRELARANNGINEPNVPSPPSFVGNEPLNGQQRYQVLCRLLGEESPRALAQLLQLGGAYCAEGDFDKALSVLRRVLDSRRRVLGSDHPETAAAANELAIAYYRLGAYVDAEPLLREARDILEKAGETDDARVYGNCLSSLALVYQAMGDFDRAEPLLKKIINLRAPENGPVKLDPNGNPTNDNKVVQKYSSLMGEFNVSAAQPRFHRQNVETDASRSRRRRYAPNLSYLAPFLNNLAIFYESRGKHQLAEEQLRQALSLLRNHGAEQAVTLSNLAVLYESQGNLDRAELLLERVIELRKESADYEPKYATALNSLGTVCWRRGDLMRAGQLWNEAFQRRSKLLGETNPNTLRCLANVALLADRNGQTADAAVQLDTLLDRAAGNLRLATAVQSERQQLLLRQGWHGYLDQFLSVSTRAALPPETVYRHVLAWKGAVAADQRRLREYRQLARGKGNEEVASLLSSLDDTTRKLANMAFGARSDNETTRKEFSQLSLQKDELERQLAGRAKQLGRRGSDELTPAQLKELLPSKTALVDLIEYSHILQPSADTAVGKDGELARERRLLAFVVRKGQPVAIHELSPADKIEKLVDACRDLWLRGKRAADTDPATDLRAAVWEPLVANLDGAETVLVSPDGAANRLPLAALPGKEPGTYLIEDVALAIVPAPQLLGDLLAGASAKAGAAPKMLLVGNVDFGADPGSTASTRRSAAAARGGKPSDFGQLPGTAREVKAVEQLYQSKYKQGGASLLEQGAATESAVRKAAATARYLHLATHGFFAPAELNAATKSSDTSAFESEEDTTAGWNPGLLSGVVLAGVNRPRSEGLDDGILTAAEVADMNLGATQLVVLSACETGLGQMAGGEGALGLQRAFHVAGARTVLASLWKVDDQATQLLMTQFYDNLWNKDMPPLAAFRAAQLSLLKGTVDVTALRGFDVDGEQPADDPAGKRLSPRLWAAFVLSGSPN
jgi:CHAT domain-containing protein